MKHPSKITPWWISSVAAFLFHMTSWAYTVHFTFVNDAGTCPSGYCCYRRILSGYTTANLLASLGCPNETWDMTWGSGSQTISVTYGTSGGSYNDFAAHSHTYSSADDGANVTVHIFGSGGPAHNYKVDANLCNNSSFFQTAQARNHDTGDVIASAYLAPGQCVPFTYDSGSVKHGIDYFASSVTGSDGSDGTLTGNLGTGDSHWYDSGIGDSSPGRAPFPGIPLSDFPNADAIPMVTLTNSPINWTSIPPAALTGSNLALEGTLEAFASSNARLLIDGFGKESYALNLLVSGQTAAKNSADASANSINSHLASLDTKATTANDKLASIDTSTAKVPTGLTNIIDKLTALTNMIGNIHDTNLYTAVTNFAQHNHDDLTNGFASLTNGWSGSGSNLNDQAAAGGSSFASASNAFINAIGTSTVTSFGTPDMFVIPIPSSIFGISSIDLNPYHDSRVATVGGIVRQFTLWIIRVTYCFAIYGIFMGLLQTAVQVPSSGSKVVAQSKIMSAVGFAISGIGVTVIVGFITWFFNFVAVNAVATWMDTGALNPSTNLGHLIWTLLNFVFPVAEGIGLLASYWSFKLTAGSVWIGVCGAVKFLVG